MHSFDKAKDVPVDRHESIQTCTVEGSTKPDLCRAQILTCTQRLASSFVPLYHHTSGTIRRRIPDFRPTKVLDFGAGTGSGLWAVQEVWPMSVERVNIVEPSQSMQRAGRNLIQGGEIPSLKDRITVVRQLWDLTDDLLKLRKLENKMKKAGAEKAVLDLKSGAHIVAQELWPLDGMKLETLKERRANKKPEDLEIDYVPYIDPRAYDSDTTWMRRKNKKTVLMRMWKRQLKRKRGVRERVWEADGEESFSRKGKQVTLDMCVPTKEDGSEGAFERRVVTKSKNPDLHLQAKKSFWGDLWPLTTQQESGKEKAS
ncbi:PREDICTED: methyltransferase-like protein 17, mitochondrial [Camelina sativa]|uniref:Methyltransferase-like protein 17, mitochondrial n=1 Tax=Camelina sativa TaxID=90675 RepID=A0ABM1QFY0_CAMSA|nr:PREDICTED: methyltransferase-like protein 17, mitochondrial [Camelina sativa]